MGVGDSLDTTSLYSYIFHCKKITTPLHNVWQVSLEAKLIMRCSVEVLQDWHAMVEALTDDSANQARGDAATTNLTMLLAAAVRSATSAAPSGTRADARCVSTISRHSCFLSTARLRYWRQASINSLPLSQICNQQFISHWD